ncbi:MAG: hypothetical protein M1819_004199 [Sarea resinae]|nr:MAG: hypothetical protein M1819_004199 [Sarea resinae]
MASPEGKSVRCHLCPGRPFKGREALTAHWTFSPKHAWCAKCKAVFRDDAARKHHYKASVNHHMCFDQNCKAYLQELDSLQILLAHQAKFHNGCSLCNTIHPSQEALDQHHREIHHGCLECHRQFEKQDALAQHKLSHLPINRTCFGCRDVFPSISALISHYESGICPLRMNLHVLNTLASEPWHSSLYMPTPSPTPGCQYQCPTCKSPWALLSGLFAHIEGNACAEELTHSLGTVLQHVRLTIEIVTPEGFADTK